MKIVTENVKTFDLVEKSADVSKMAQCFDFFWGGGGVNTQGYM